MEKVEFVLTKFVLNSKDKEVEISLGDIIECTLKKNKFTGKVCGINQEGILLDCSYKYSAKTQTVIIRSLVDVEVVNYA